MTFSIEWLGLAAITLAALAYLPQIIHMFKVRIRRILSGLQSVDASSSEMWRNDPLSHPDLQTMSLNQLADLPFDRTRNHENS